MRDFFNCQWPQEGNILSQIKVWEVYCRQFKTTSCGLAFIQAFELLSDLVSYLQGKQTVNQLCCCRLVKPPCITAWPARTPSVDTHNLGKRRVNEKLLLIVCRHCRASASAVLCVYLHHDQHQQVWEQKPTKTWSAAEKKILITSNDTNAKIEMYDRGPEGSEHHAGADQDSSDHDHRSAAIAVDKYATHRSWGDERNNQSSGLHSFTERFGCPDSLQHWPPAYIDASITEETQAIWL